MRRILVGLATVGTLLAPAAQATYAFKISGDNLYRNGTGGEFTVTPIGVGNPLNNYLSNYDSKALYPATSPQTSFQTFCIENTELITLTRTYYAEISHAAKYSGTTSTPDPISVGTAYLYYKFAKGQLAGYDYTVAAGLREVDAEKLQRTIWWLEGDGSVAEPTNNEFKDAVLSLFGSAAAAMADNWQNGVMAYPVMALNVWVNADGTGVAQDQLILVPAVPEPSTLIAAGLLGVPFLVSVWRRRSAQR